MTKISNSTYNGKSSKCSATCCKSEVKPHLGSHTLDTLAQLTTGHEKMIKRQKAKAITNAQVFPLIDLKSKLHKSYWRSYHCNNVILQEGHKVTAKYCNARWCTVCNRIRMAKMINAYSIPLLELKDLYFVTLTTPNCKAVDLRDEMNGMYKSWRAINQNIRKTYGIKLKGVRKLECTYNHHADTYNPHFHLLVESKEAAKALISLWLQRYPAANRRGQDMRKANKGSLVELFKYTVKGVHKGKFYPEALDVIYQALEKRRTYQPFGIKKVVEEDIDGIISEEITFKGYRDEVWKWSKDAKDWYNFDGELFTEYVIQGKLSDWIDNLIEDDTYQSILDAERPVMALSG